MSSVIKTIEHTATKNILFCRLESRLYVGLMLAHISEGVALPKAGSHGGIPGLGVYSFFLCKILLPKPPV